MRNDYQRPLDIQEGIERIEKYTAGGRADFDRSEAARVNRSTALLLSGLWLLTAAN